MRGARGSAEADPFAGRSAPPSRRHSGTSLCGTRSRQPRPTRRGRRIGDFPWYALSGRACRAKGSGPGPEDGRARPALRCLGLDPLARRLTVSVSLDGSPRALRARSTHPTASALAALGAAGVGRLAGCARPMPLAPRMRSAERPSANGSSASSGSHWSGWPPVFPARFPAIERHALALLQLTRVLFLYFVQAKGWLAGQQSVPRRGGGSLPDEETAGPPRSAPAALLRHPQPSGWPSAAARRSASARSLFSTAACSSRIRWSAGSGATSPTPSGATRSTACSSASISPSAEGERGGDRARHARPGVRGRHGAGGAACVGHLLHARGPGSPTAGEGVATAVAHQLGCAQAEAERRLVDRDPAATRAGSRTKNPRPRCGLRRIPAGCARAALVIRPRRCLGGGAERRILQRNLFGVDRNGAAVRLTELRLWLAVIADDHTERPDEVQPLPNLDCLVRQGDSLFDPIGSGFRVPVDRRRSLAVGRPAAAGGLRGGPGQEAAPASAGAG